MDATDKMVSLILDFTISQFLGSYTSRLVSREGRIMIKFTKKEMGKRIHRRKTGHRRHPHPHIRRRTPHPPPQRPHPPPTRTHARTHARACARTHTHTCTHAHTHTHTRTLARACAYTHTHTHPLKLSSVTTSNDEVRRNRSQLGGMKG